MKNGVIVDSLSRKHKKKMKQLSTKRDRKDAKAKIQLRVNNNG